MVRNLSATISSLVLLLSLLSCAEKSREGQSVQAPEPPADLHSQTNPAQQDTIDALIERVSSQDYSQDIAAGASFAAPFESATEGNAGPPNVWLDTVNNAKRAVVKRDGLSPKELKRLSAWSYHGMSRDFPVLCNHVGMFVNAEGRLPTDGKELFQHTLSGDDAASFQTLGNSEQASALSLYLDPLTGKLWGRLDSQQWSPLGVSFRRVPDDETIADFGGVDVIGTEQNGCTLAFQLELTLWGEEPDEILFRGKTAMFFPPMI